MTENTLAKEAQSDTRHKKCQRQGRRNHHAVLIKSWLKIGMVSKCEFRKNKFMVFFLGACTEGTAKINARKKKIEVSSARTAEKATGPLPSSIEGKISQLLERRAKPSLWFCKNVSITPELPPRPGNTDFYK